MHLPNDELWRLRSRFRQQSAVPTLFGSISTQKLPIPENIIFSIKGLR